MRGREFYLTKRTHALQGRLWRVFRNSGLMKIRIFTGNCFSQRCSACQKDNCKNETPDVEEIEPGVHIDTPLYCGLQVSWNL